MSNHYCENVRAWERSTLLLELEAGHYHKLLRTNEGCNKKAFPVWERLFDD